MIPREDPVVGDPTDPTKFYLYRLYSSFFWGPFDSIADARVFYQRKMKEDKYFDYDPIACTRGADPLPASYADLPYVRSEWRT